MLTVYYMHRKSISLNFLNLYKHKLIPNITGVLVSKIIFYKEKLYHYTLNFLGVVDQDSLG